jgi:hypothetical protein
MCSIIALLKRYDPLLRILMLASLAGIILSDSFEFPMGILLFSAMIAMSIFLLAFLKIGEESMGIKTTKQMVEREIIESVECDMCGTNCKKEMNIEAAHLSAQWGYESNHDGDSLDVWLCEECAEKVQVFVGACRSTMQIAENSRIQKLQKENASAE